MDYRNTTFQQRQQYRQQQRQRQRQKRNQTIKTFFLFLFVSILMICLITMKSNETKRNYHYETTITYFVSQGETLWSIANQFSDNRHDTRKVVWEIQKLSDTTALIFPGQELTIPLFTVMQGGDN